MMVLTRTFSASPPSMRLRSSVAERYNSFTQAVSV
jgi:hypothetical protein